MIVDRDGKPHTVATIGGIAQTPRFSPDGKQIALLVTIGAAKELGATQAGVRQIGEIGEKSDEQRLAVFDVGATLTADKVRPLSPADRYIYEYDRTPDGSGFVVTSALGNGDNNWWVATLDAVDAKTGAVRNIAKPRTQLNFPRVSPDGKTVAYIGGLMKHFGSVGGDVGRRWRTAQYPARQQADRDLAGLARRRDPRHGAPRRPDGALCRRHEWAMQGLELRRASPRATPRQRGSADGKTVATVSQDFTHAPAIFAGPVDAPVQVTHDNDAIPREDDRAQHQLEE